MENGLNASDVALLSNNGGFGNGNSIFYLFALMMLANGGFGGWGNRGDYGQYASAASQQEILFGQQFSNLDNKMDRGFTSIGNGISSATFSLNNSIKDGIANVAGTVVNEGRAIQGQIADLNLTTQRNTDALRYDMAQMFYNSDTKHTAEMQAIKDILAQNRIETLQGRVNQLELQAAMCGVVRYPNSMTYDAGGSPFCNCNNNGCCCR